MHKNFIIVAKTYRLVFRTSPNFLTIHSDYQEISANNKLNFIVTK